VCPAANRRRRHAARQVPNRFRWPARVGVSLRPTAPRTTGVVNNALSARLLGFPQVKAATGSVRLHHDKAKRELGWQPRYMALTGGLPLLVTDFQGQPPPQAGSGT